MASNSQGDPAQVSTGPLWSRVRDDLVTRIRSGEFGSSDFPGELEIATHYDVSRGTVRAALRTLRESGLVSAERGRRPRIVAPEEPSSYGPIYSLFEQVTAAGLSQRSVTLVQRRCTHPEAAERMGLDPGHPLFELARIRYADEVALAVDHAWLPWELAEPLAAVDFATTALYKELRDRCGISLDGGTEHLSAAVVTPEIAAILGCSPAAVAFTIDRVGCRAGTTVEFRRTHILAADYTVERRFGTSIESPVRH